MTSQTNDQPYYIIVAGVDGVGKTTLYQTAPELFYNTRRIDPNKVVQMDRSAWSSGEKKLKEKATLLEEISKALEKKESIHFETTLAGPPSGHLRGVKRAKELGYKVILFYIDSYDIDLIHKRLVDQKITIPFEKLEERYHKSHAHMLEVMFQADRMMILDNTEYFEVVQMKWD